MLLYLVWFRRDQWGLLAVQLCVLFFCFTQLRFFQKCFIEMRTYDIISVWLLLGNKVIPYFYMPQ